MRPFPSTSRCSPCTDRLPSPATPGAPCAGGALLATNATGHPQLALRAGYAQRANRTRFRNAEEAEGATTHRVPRGISLWGDLFQEGKIIALGRALEARLGVAGDRPPGF